MLFVGRLTKEKNIPNLLNAVPKVLGVFPNTLFIIVGKGDERPNLKKLTVDLGIEENVIFTGAVPDVADYYYLSDLLVLPSNHEGRAIVLIEAMACGKPVISTDVGGTRDVIVDGKNGFIVPLGDSDAISQKIILLLSNPKKMISMGEIGQEFVIKTQDIKKNAYMLREIFDKTISEKNTT